MVLKLFKLTPETRRKGDRPFKGMNEENHETQKTPVRNDGEIQAEADSDAKRSREMSQDELLEKLDEAIKLADKHYDLYVRSQAEMENFKKRQKREKEDWLKYATESLIKELLPSLDNLEKALAHADSEDSGDALKQGVGLTLKGLKDALAKSGLEEVPARGEAFDPCFHEAVSQIENDRVKPGTIVEELQKGYLLNKRLIRPAMVVVSKSGSSQADQGEGLAGACEKNH
jgi:molecular chaperone GrpE